jgi:hypothetical protein
MDFSDRVTGNGTLVNDFSSVPVVLTVAAAKMAFSGAM